MFQAQTKNGIIQTRRFATRVDRRTPAFFQPKLTVNTPGDAYEQEADRIADQVMHIKDGGAPVVQRMPLSTVPRIQRKCAKCEREEQAQRKEAFGASGGFTAPPIVQQTLARSSGGQPMDASTRQFMESRFGQDFSQVRIHTDAQAAHSAAAIQAGAYTSGRHIVFGQGQYQPYSDSGRRLLAHELVHVGQQREGTVQRACVGGRWQFEYDGCSVPPALATFFGIDKDNPAGGADTHFGSRTGASQGLPCDLHDECYQTCGSDRSACDWAMLINMLAVCARSTATPAIRKKCRDWAYRYYAGLRVGGASAHRQRQSQVCHC